MEITIRSYEPQDWPRLMAVHDAARKNELFLAGMPEAFLPLEIAAEREGLFDYAVVVALLDSVVVGFAAYSTEELAWLYVDPAFSRRGVGRALVRYVTSHSAERPLSTAVLAGNEPALNLYSSMGFTLKQTLNGVMPGNESYPVTVHCLRLD